YPTAARRANPERERRGARFHPVAHAPGSPGKQKSPARGVPGRATRPGGRSPVGRFHGLVAGTRGGAGDGRPGAPAVTAALLLAEPTEQPAAEQLAAAGRGARVARVAL